MIAVSDLASGPILTEDHTHAPSAAHTSPLPPSRAAFRYCLVLLLLPLVIIPACIRLGYSDFFLRHGASVWVQSNDAIFNIHDRPCDVLIYGDSTAMTGINPAVVERNTGFKTCNISVTNSVLSVTHNLTLNRYLANNPRPRVLLIQLSPDGFQPESNSWDNTVYPEGLLELLRHGTPTETRRVLVHHPREAIAFAGYAAGFTLYSLGKDTWSHLTHTHPPQQEVAIHNGFFTPPSPPTTRCEPGATFSNPAAGGEFPRTLVDQYRTLYAGRSAVVLVNVAPIPACDQNLQAFTTELDGITSNPVLPLPVTLFNDPRHYTAVGSAVVSRLVAEEVNAAAQRNPQIYEQIDDSLPPGNIASLKLTHITP
ncbi:MAG TPA: hypothetical protein VGU46_11615 [Acidobacteriaceae bacterium]|nr:hypothetical protein [Acidobacteriaceae bacterium]